MLLSLDALLHLPCCLGAPLDSLLFKLNFLGSQSIQSCSLFLPKLLVSFLRLFGGLLGRVVHFHTALGGGFQCHALSLNCADSCYLGLCFLATSGFAPGLELQHALFHRNAIAEWIVFWLASLQLCFETLPNAIIIGLYSLCCHSWLGQGGQLKEQLLQQRSRAFVNGACRKGWHPGHRQNLPNLLSGKDFIGLQSAFRQEH
mmetsp:Transcript_21226/g.49183  ORF Transcript_21226/g.49183 Transcript_21226/m.49183 type:complete len:202 (-) Transcript_21226:303-908(-)